MPYLQMIALIVEQSLPSQLHAEDEEAEQLRQSSAEDIETEIQLKSISQVGEGVLPKCTMLVCTDDLAIYFP